MLLLVQSSRRITRVEELGSFKAEGVTTQVIGFILRLHLGVKTIQKAHRPIFTKRLCNSLKSGIRPAINRNVRVGPVHKTPIQGDDYKRAGEIVLIVMQEEAAANRLEVLRLVGQPDLFKKCVVHCQSLCTTRPAPPA